MAVAKPKVYTYTEAGNLVVAAHRAARRYAAADAAATVVAQKIRSILSEIERTAHRARRSRLLQRWEALSEEFTVLKAEAEELWVEYEAAALRLRRSGAIDQPQLERVRY